MVDGESCTAFVGVDGGEGEVRSAGGGAFAETKLTFADRDGRKRGE